MGFLSEHGVLKGLGAWRVQGLELAAYARRLDSDQDAPAYYRGSVAVEKFFDGTASARLASWQKQSGLTVACYEVGLAYGGPEEGGWYYRAGTRLWSRKFRTIHARNKFLRTKVLPAFEGHRAFQIDMEQTSSDGEHEVMLFNDGRMAVPSFPQFRPHYE